ncbi:MAG TPA: SLC13 family permease [Thermoplasmata archaeon]|nr:SLC13 family permease [Thermoplasmata archaeon]
MVAVFAAVAVRQLSGRGPGIWLLFVGGGAAAVLLGALSPIGAATTLANDAPLLLFLFALFLFATALEAAGALDHLARWLIGRARRASDLPAVLFLGFGIVSAFLVNDALVLIGVPVLLALARRLRTGARPLLMVLAFSVTVGSALTPFGNPQNLLVSVQSGIPSPFVTFLRYLLVPTAINLAVGAVYLRRLYGPRMPSDAGTVVRGQDEPSALLPSGGWSTRLGRFPVLAIFPATLAAIVAVDLLAAVSRGPVVPSWEVAGAGAVVLLAASPARSRIVRGIQWEVLLLFAGLFVVVAAASAGGVVAGLGRILPVPGPGHPLFDLLGIAGTSLVGSQLVSNVPWVGLQVSVLHHLGYGGTPAVPWLALAGASTLAGNVTLLGAASNLIVVQLAERAGVPIRLGTFVRDGLPLAALTVGVLVACLWLGL